MMMTIKKIYHKTSDLDLVTKTLYVLVTKRVSINRICFTRKNFQIELCSVSAFCIAIFHCDIKPRRMKCCSVVLHTLTIIKPKLSFKVPIVIQFEWISLTHWAYTKCSANLLTIHKVLFAKHLWHTFSVKVLSFFGRLSHFN